MFNPSLFLPSLTSLMLLQRSFLAKSWTTIVPSRTTTRACLSMTQQHNHFDAVSSLRNNYYALRHGQSLANVAKIIAANPQIASSKYGLSDLGKDQAKVAGHTVVEEFQSNNFDGILILCSDLLRAKETAEVTADAVQNSSSTLYNNGVVVETRLRERGFGKWDGGPDQHYNDVWKDDAVDPTHELNEVESVMSVTDRASSMILEWDKKFENYMVICVAHGDVLQILQTAFSRMDGSLHRTLDHLETATLRYLPLAPKSNDSS